MLFTKNKIWVLPYHFLLFHFLILTQIQLLGQPDLTRFFSKAEIEYCHTASQSVYLNSIEKEVYLYNNLARLYPNKFALYFKEYCSSSQELTSKFSKNYYFKSLYTQLKSAEPAPLLLPDQDLFVLAKCWADESGSLGIIGHDRIQCSDEGYLAENCAYGYTTGLEIVMQLLIDEEVKGLGHRVNMLNPTYRGLGVAVSNHNGYGTVAVQNFGVRSDKEKEKNSRDTEKLKNILADWDKEALSKADIARALPYLNKIEKDFYLLVNLARLYPEEFLRKLWKAGPYFTPQNQDSINYKSRYNELAKMLMNLSPQAVLIPKKEKIDEVHCLKAKVENGQKDLVDCLTNSGSYSLSTFEKSDPWLDIFSILMDEDHYKDWFTSEVWLVVVRSEKADFKVILKN